MTIATYKRVPVLGDQYAFERTVIHVPQVIQVESPTSQTLPATAPAAESATSGSVQVPSKQSSDNVQDTGHAIKQQKKLDNWFKPGTDHDVRAYHDRTQLEWEERLEETKQEAGEHRQAVKQHAAKLATERKHHQRAKQVDADIKSGRCDSTGKLIKAKVNYSFGVCNCNLQFHSQSSLFLNPAPCLQIPTFLKLLALSVFSRKNNVNNVVLQVDREQYYTSHLC